ncbi:hypothetical protein MRX96_046785 [Rhipicephalus microplus]
MEARLCPLSPRLQALFHHNEHYRQQPAARHKVGTEHRESGADNGSGCSGTTIGRGTIAVRGNLGILDQLCPERLEAFFEANDATSDSKKWSIPISDLNPETYTGLRSLLASSKPMDKRFDTIVRAFTQHLSPEPSEIYETFRFQTRVQNSGERVADYLAELRNIAGYCGSRDTLERNLRDRFVIGLREKGVQWLLLAKPRILTL